jgi:hypothetical protein
MFETTMTFVLVAVFASASRNDALVVTQIPVVNGAACEFAKQSMIAQLEMSDVGPLGLVCIATTVRNAEEMSDAVNERSKALERFPSAGARRELLWNELPVTDIPD